MSLTRRSLFKITGASAAGALVGRLTNPRVPVLHRDGKTDDAEALEAWGDGRPVNFRGATGVLTSLVGLSLFSSRTVPMNSDGLTIDRCQIAMPPSGLPAIRIGAKTRNARVTSCYFHRDMW